MNRLEKLKNEMADHLHKTMPLHGSIGYTASKAFRDGFETAAAEYEKIIAVLEGALETTSAYLQWREDDLIGDDCIGDGKLTAGFKNRLATINEALQKLSDFKNE